MKLLTHLDGLSRTCPSFAQLARDAAAALKDAMPRYRTVSVAEGATEGAGVPICWGGVTVARLIVEGDNLNDADDLLLREAASILAARWGRENDPGGVATRTVAGGPAAFAAGLHPVSPPIHGAAAFAFERMDDLEAFHAHPERDFIYTRWGNPTVRAAEETIAGLEGAEVSLLHASGMAAIANALLSTVSAGDEVVSAHDTYGGSHHLLARVLPRFGVSVRFVSIDALAASITSRTRAVFFEPLTNPAMRVVDLPAVVAASRAVGACVIVDNTVASPLFLRPLAHGVDIVVHSATKYLGGHSDLIAGVASGSRARMSELERGVRLLGACFNPREASLLLRGLQTLDLRVRRQDATARRIAAWLEARRDVQRVWHPSLSSHPDHVRARALLEGFGCLVTFDLADAACARRVADRLVRFQRAASLGGVESLVTIPVLSSHWKVDEESLRASCVTPATIRLSVGVEDPDDLIADLARALDAES